MTSSNVNQAYYNSIKTAHEMTQHCNIYHDNWQLPILGLQAVVTCSHLCAPGSIPATYTNTQHE